MKPQDLLKERRKVIAPYPFSAYEIGHVIEFEDDKSNYPLCSIDNITRYAKLPHFDKYKELFLPLKWWEERKPEDMPEYMKYFHEDWEKTVVIKVSQWDLSDGGARWENADRLHDWYIIENTDEIATEEEYNAYLQSK